MPDAAHHHAADHLAAADPAFAALIARIGPCTAAPALREPYEALVRAIAHQQLHGRAAQAILARLAALHPGPAFPQPDQLAATPDEAMRACGFSGSKIAAIRDICTHALNGTVPAPSHAGNYSAVLHYLKAVAAAKSVEAKAVIAKMHELPVGDDVVRHATLRPDGRLVHDTYVFRVKTPAESKGEWDLYDLIGTVPADQAFRPLSESACPAITK